MDYLLAISMILFFADENLSAQVKFLDTHQIFLRSTIEDTVERYLDTLHAPAYNIWVSEWRHADETNTYTRLIRQKGSITSAATGQVRVKFGYVHIIEQ